MRDDSSTKQLYASIDLNDEEITERKHSLEIGPQDEARLLAIHDELKPLARRFIPELYDFYRHFEPTQRFFHDDTQVEHLCRTQLAYFDDLTCGDYGSDYFAHRLAVGVTHARVGLAPKWYLSAYRRYFKALIPYLHELRKDDSRRFLDELDSLIKIIFLDMGLAMEAYHQTASLEETRHRRHLQKILEQLPSGVLLLDSLGRIISANATARLILQLQEGEFEGTDYRQVASLDELRQAIDNAAPDRPWHGEVMLDRVSGERRYLAVHAIRIENGENGAETLVTIEDFTALRQVEEESLRLATSDILTGLANRLQLTERLSQGIAGARRQGTRLGVLFLDLDNFKYINDSLGHAAGDQLLQQLAERLRRVTRASDTLARFGGDEFVLVANDIRDRSDCERIIGHLMEVFQRPYVLEGREFRLAGSIGIALYPDDAEDPHSLLKYADAAMYQAKKAQGRTPYCFFSQRAHRSFTNRLDLEQALRQAVAEKAFELRYQPIVSLRDMRITGCETLMRWHHPELGNIPPTRFIPLLEESGQIQEVGDWVLHEVARRAGRFQPWQFAVNVASQQFADPDFARRIFLLLADRGLPVECLELELTESTLLEPTDATIDNLNALSELGVSLAIDDFGTGYSSLSYLRRFPIRRLKIDRSFIKDITLFEEAASLARAIVGLGRTLNLAVTAEGIETADQLALLRQWGCDSGQGFYLSEPLTAEELAELYERQGHCLQETSDSRNR